MKIVKKRKNHSKWVKITLKTSKNQSKKRGILLKKSENHSKKVNFPFFLGGGGVKRTAVLVLSRPSVHSFGVISSLFWIITLFFEWLSLVLGVIFTRLEWFSRFSMIFTLLRVTISLFLHEISTQFLCVVMKCFHYLIGFITNTDELSCWR